MLSYFHGLQHVRPDVNTVNLNRAKIVVPIYEKDFSNLRLAVLSIQPIYGTNYSYQTAVQPYTINFMTRLHSDTQFDKLVRSVATNERVWKTLDRSSKNTPKCVANPSEKSLAMLLNLEEEDFGKLSTDSAFNAHVGSFFCALNNLGYIIYKDGTYSEFPTHCAKYMPPFVLTKLEEVKPLNKSFDMPRMFINSAFVNNNTVKW